MYIMNSTVDSILSSLPAESTTFYRDDQNKQEDKVNGNIGFDKMATTVFCIMDVVGIDND